MEIQQRLSMQTVSARIVRRWHLESTEADQSSYLPHQTDLFVVVEATPAEKRRLARYGFIVAGQRRRKA